MTLPLTFAGPSTGLPVNWWDPNNEGLCVWAAYQPKGAASLATSYTDLSGNGNDGVGIGPPAWDAVNGWKFAGTYVVTTFIPENDQSQSMLIQFTNFVSTSWLCGSLISITQNYGIYNDLGPSDIYYCNGDSDAKSPVIAAGNLGIAGNKGYRNGADDGVTIPAWVGSSTLPFYIGCASGGGGPVGLSNVYVQAVALYDCVLTGPQMASIAAEMAAL